MLISGRKAVRVVLPWLCAFLAFAGCCGQSIIPNAAASSVPPYTDVPNGDFELAHGRGEWAGWTKQEGAFHVRGLKSSDTVDGVQVEKSGNTFFSGYDAGLPSMRGTLTSDVFPLTGTGVISFMMGAGLHKNLVYVEFFQVGDEKPLARVSNTDCDGVFITEQLITRTVDLSNYIGTEIYIKVTDLDTGDELSYVNLDNFHVCQTKAEVDAAQAQRTRQLKEYKQKDFKEDQNSTTIVNGGFETGDLTGWKLLEGRAIRENCVTPTSQYYWEDRMVYGEGNYYFDGSNNGAVRERLTGAMRSTKFTLGGDGWISFMMGCGNGDCYVALCDGKTGKELIVQRNEAFSDPALALTLLRKYMDASDYVGQVVYLKVANNNPAATGFAFLNVDDFRVSLTREEVAALEAEQIESIYAQTYNSATYDDLATLRDYYDNYPYPVPMKALLIRDGVKDKVVECGKKVDVTAMLGGGYASYDGQSLTDFRVTGVTLAGEPVKGDLTAVDMSTPGQYQVHYEIDHAGRHASSSFTVFAVTDRGQLLNGGFETGDLTGWTVLTKGFNRNTAVISATSYWGDALPYNQAGGYHLNGWNTGLGNDADTWSVRSSTFRLSGSGYISWRMGGNAAAVRVYRADGTQIAYVRQTRFNDVNFPYLSKGGSWADMGTYVLDLSAHLGEELYIVLQDEEVEGGWANAFFDEIITRYDTPPDVARMADKVADGGTRASITIPWRMAVEVK